MAPDLFPNLLKQQAMMIHNKEWMRDKLMNKGKMVVSRKTAQNWSKSRTKAQLNLKTSG
jgi:hypothetical protein